MKLHCIFPLLVRSALSFGSVDVEITSAPSKAPTLAPTVTIYDTWQSAFDGEDLDVFKSSHSSLVSPPRKSVRSRLVRGDAEEAKVPVVLRSWQEGSAPPETPVARMELTCADIAAGQGPFSESERSSCPSSAEDAAAYLAESLAGLGLEHCPVYTSPMMAPGFAVDAFTYLGQLAAVCHAVARTGISHICHSPPVTYAYEARGADAETQVRTIICHKKPNEISPGEIGQENDLLTCHTESGESLLAVFNPETKTCARA